MANILVLMTRNITNTIIMKTDTEALMLLVLSIFSFIWLLFSPLSLYPITWLGVSDLPGIYPAN